MCYTLNVLKCKELFFVKTEKAYLLAKEKYAEIGVDTDKVWARLQNTVISMHCWQGDDVNGFLFKDVELSGGIQTTGNYPGAARTADELRADIEKAMTQNPLANTKSKK